VQTPAPGLRTPRARSPPRIRPCASTSRPD
jgi:hypothetical protein